MDNKICVIVGKFQVPELTEAHVDLLQHAVNCYNKIIVLTGISPIICSKSIIPISVVQHNVVKCLEEAILQSTRRYDIQYAISSVTDVYNIPIWSNIVDDLLKNIIENKFSEGFNPDNVEFVGGRDSFTKNYVGVVKNIYDFQSKHGDEVSATKVRERIIANGVSTDPKFLEGMIFQDHRRYATAYQAVDVAILYMEPYKEDEPVGKISYLLGRKPNQSKFRFVGGISDPESNSLEEDAIREAKEETEVVLKSVNYIFSTKQNDPRYKGTKDCIKTAFFHGITKSKHAIASDDLEGGEVRWFYDYEICEEMFVEEHKHLFRKYQEYLANHGVPFGVK